LHNLGVIQSDALESMKIVESFTAGFAAIPLHDAIAILEAAKLFEFSATLRTCRHLILFRPCPNVTVYSPKDTARGFGLWLRLRWFTPAEPFVLMLTKR